MVDHVAEVGQIVACDFRHGKTVTAQETVRIPHWMSGYDKAYAGDTASATAGTS